MEVIVDEEVESFGGCGVVSGGVVASASHVMAYSGCVRKELFEGDFRLRWFPLGNIVGY